jgi:segregation and condensation protein B
VADLSLSAQIEAVLFMANEPLSLSALCRLTKQSKPAVTAALNELHSRLSQSGIRLSELDGAYRLVTAPEATPILNHFLDDTSKAELTPAALETLAIIAYRGPIARSAVEQLRGVSSEAMIRNLAGRGLIVEAGRGSGPGRPVQYMVSQTFLEHFGLTSLADLPKPPESTAETTESHAN